MKKRPLLLFTLFMLMCMSLTSILAACGGETGTGSNPTATVSPTVTTVTTNPIATPSANPTTTTGSTTAILVGVRIGYNLPLTDGISLWPRLGLEYMRVSFDTPGGGSSSGYVVPLNIFVPVLWHPAQHFFVGGGPVVTTDLISKASGQNTAKETQIGIEGVLGGYFGL